MPGIGVYLSEGDSDSTPLTAAKQNVCASLEHILITFLSTHAEVAIKKTQRDYTS